MLERANGGALADGGARIAYLSQRSTSGFDMSTESPCLQPDTGAHSTKYQWSNDLTSPENMVHHRSVRCRQWRWYEIVIPLNANKHEKRCENFDSSFCICSMVTCSPRTIMISWKIHHITATRPDHPTLCRKIGCGMDQVSTVGGWEVAVIQMCPPCAFCECLDDHVAVHETWLWS